MAGSNLKFSMSPELPRRILKAMGFRGMGGKVPRHAFPDLMCSKAGVPAATGATSDDPTKVNVICLDETNDDVYICTAYTNSSTHTWTKITN